MEVNRKQRWQSKEQCQKWLETSKATGLRRLAALGYLNGSQNKRGEIR